MKISIAVCLTVLACSLLSGCNERTIEVVDEQPQPNVEVVNTIEDDKELVEEVKLLDSGEIEERLLTLKQNDNLKDYIGTALLSGQVNNSDTPYNLMTYSGELVKCDLDIITSDNKVDVIIEIMDDRSHLDYEQLEVLVRENIVRYDLKDYEITLIVNDTIIGNF